MNVCAAQQAAYLLLQAMPSALDPDAFAIPPPLSWDLRYGDGVDGPRTRSLPRSPVPRSGRAELGHGVPLRLVARHPDVAWEVDGQLQLLIGAAKRTGDPRDVW